MMFTRTTVPMARTLRVLALASVLLLRALPVTGRSLSSPAPPGTYTFRVAAQNACGTGPNTSVATATIP